MRWQDLQKAGANANIERRRGGGKAVKGGIGGSIIMGLIAIFFFNQDPGQVVSSIAQQQMGGGSSTYRPSAEDEMNSDFMGRIKQSTDIIWTDLFQKSGANYKIPKLVDYKGRTQMSVGGVADARMGPFYLPAESTIYIDTDFFDEMKQRFGGGGDFAYAYVISHEVGHHVQHLLGLTDRVHSKKGRIPEVQYNQLSVRLELQADYLAGVWAHHADKRFRQNNGGKSLLEEGDIQEAMRAAKAIGDDALQRQAGGRVVEDSFTHGSSEQRLRWFMKGLKSGSVAPRDMDTFSVSYNSL